MYLRNKGNAPKDTGQKSEDDNDLNAYLDALSQFKGVDDRSPSLHSMRGSRYVKLNRNTGESDVPSESYKSDSRTSPELPRCEEGDTYSSQIKKVSSPRITSTPKCECDKSILSDGGSPTYSESFVSSSPVKPTQLEAIETEDSRSSSPSLSDTSEKSAISHATFTKEAANVDEYSDDFESSSEDESLPTVQESVVSCSPCDRLSRSSTEVSSISSSRHSQVSNKSKPVATTMVKTAVRKPIKIEEKPRSCEAGTMTEADVKLNGSLAPPSIWEEHSTFVAAVAATVERILTRRSAVPHSHRNQLDTREFIDAVNANSPCLKAVDRVLKEQLELTRAFLTTQNAVHEALKEALQQCTLPAMKPLGLRFNYATNTKTGT